MANHFSIAGEDAIRIGKQRSAIEAEVHVAGVGGDVAKAVLQRFAGEGESDGDGVPFGDGFNGIGGFVEHDVAES